MTEPKYPDIKVRLTGKDGNAFAVMGAVARALGQAGIPEAEITEYRLDSMSGDYHHLLRTAGQWVTIS